MNDHAGPACVLSFLIVGIFAVLLHDKNLPPPTVADRSRDPAEARAILPNQAGSEVQSPATRTAGPTPRPLGAPRPDAIEPRSSSSAGSRGGPHPGRAPPLPEVPGAIPPRSTARGPYTVVGVGESLKDVAARVYGPSGTAESLWKANRDQLDRPDSTIPPGTLLRTP